MTDRSRFRKTALLLFLVGGGALGAVPLAGPEPETGRSGAAAAAATLVPAPAPSSVEAGPPPILLPVHRWLRPGEYAWDDDGVPAGRLSMVVDIRARTLSVYRAGVEIGRSFITHGADNKPTPTGIFPILEKDADHHSNLYDNAPMPWMLRLTRDGVAIHGADIADDAATRGCIGLPAEFAERLFREAKLGDRVIVVSGPPQGVNYTSYAALPVQPPAP